MTELLKILPDYLAMLNCNCTSELNIRVCAYCHAEKQRNSDYATFLRRVVFNHVIMQKEAGLWKDNKKAEHMHQC